MWLCMFSAVAFAQSPNNSQYPSKGKINLLNLNRFAAKHSSLELIRAHKFALDTVIQKGHFTVIKFNELNYQTLYFLNTWWLEEIGKDSINESLIKDCFNPQWDMAVADYNTAGFDKLPFDFLKQWKKELSLERRRKIQFQSFFSAVENRFNHPSIVVYLNEILKNVKVSDVNAQLQVEAIIASKEILDNYGTSKESNSFENIRFTLNQFYKNINEIDSSVASLIDVKYLKTWRGFVKMVKDEKSLHPNNPWGISEKYQEEDPSDWMFRIESNRLYLTELDQMVDDSNDYILFVEVDEDFYNKNLLPRKKAVEQKSTYLNVLYTSLVELYPTKKIERHLFRSTDDLIDTTWDDFYKEFSELLKIDTLNIKNYYINTDSIVNLFQESSEVELSENDSAAYATVVEEDEATYFRKDKRIVLESSYKRCYNNINEMLDIINPTEPRMQHISFVGGSVGVSTIRSDGNENVYKFNYHQTYGVESLSNFWGHLIGFQIDGGLYRNKFMNLAFLTNYTYGEFTITKEPGGGDIFIVNPQKLYQVKNSFFTLASGLDVKLNLSAIYVHATGGYQWDLSDGRWKYNGDYVNSLGKLKMSGGFFELGVGLNIGVK